MCGFVNIFSICTLHLRTGCSAGGAAAFMHTDWFAAQVPQAKTRGMPDSGWFLDGNYARDGKLDYDSRMKNM